MRSETRHRALAGLARPGTALACLVWGLFATLGSAAQSGGSYEIARSSIDAGGGHAAAIGFEAIGTLGQPDAATSSGADFEMHGGLWAATTQSAPDAQVFQDGFE